MQRLTVTEWLTWLAAGAAIVAALVAALLPLGGINRVSGVAVPYGIAAIALLGNGFIWRRSTWGGVGLFALASLALAYAVVLALSVPLRLAVEGTCPLDASTCPLGFEYPMRAAENAAVYACTTLGALDLVLVFSLVEIRHVRRMRTPSIK